ncbi:transposase [Flavobacteriaceae bacterium W22]|nr:transposase [Flavobacteriaceae bacterium W22]
MNFKEIHIGNLISQRVKESGIEMSRICNFIKSSEVEVLKMYESQSLETELLLRWSKLLEYDFFRIYSHHLILYSPPSAKSETIKPSSLPVFRKNIYTKEIIEFILEEIDEGKITKSEVIDKYRIPKTTLYKWIEKYKTE